MAGAVLSARRDRRGAAGPDGRRRRRHPVSARRGRTEAEELHQPPDRRSRGQVLPAGHSSRDLHALSVPDRPEPARTSCSPTNMRAPIASSTWTSRPKRRSTAGWAGRTASGKAIRWSSTSSSLNGKAWLDRAGNYTTDNVHVVERFTMTDADHINYEATIEDNKVFSRPWKISMPLYKRVEKNAQIARIQVRRVRRRDALRPSAEGAIIDTPIRISLRF